MVSTRKVIFPAFFLIAAVVLSILYNITFEVRESGLDTIIFYSALAIVSYTLLLLFQRFVNYRVLHLPMSIGWGLIFLAAVEKLNAEILKTEAFDNEQIFTAAIGIGLIFVAFSLYFWTSQMWENQRTQEQQHRVIDLYTSLMSHDAGNDLQAVLGYIEAALMIPQGFNPKSLKLIEAAQAAALRMTGLIKAFIPTEINTEQILGPLVQSAALLAEKADLGLKTTFYAQPGTESLKVAGASMIQFALANLLRNAAQHSGDKPQVDIKIFRKSEDLIISISDGGPGIPDDIKRTMFERGGSDTDRGLGLYLTKQIIVACSGMIDIVDSPVGATFRIILPIAE